MKWPCRQILSKSINSGRCPFSEYLNAAVT